MRLIFFWVRGCGTLLCHSRAPVATVCFSCCRLTSQKDQFEPFKQILKKWMNQRTSSLRRQSVTTTSQFINDAPSPLRRQQVHPFCNSSNHHISPHTHNPAGDHFFSKRTCQLIWAAAQNSSLSQWRCHPNLCQLSTKRTPQKQRLMTGRNNWVLKKSNAHATASFESLRKLFCSIFNVSMLQTAQFTMLLESSLSKTAVRFVNKWKLLVNSSCHGPCISQPVLLVNPSCCFGLQGCGQHKVSAMGFWSVCGGLWFGAPDWPRLPLRVNFSLNCCRSCNHYKGAMTFGGHTLEIGANKSTSSFAILTVGYTCLRDINALCLIKWTCLDFWYLSHGAPKKPSSSK